MVTLTSSSAGSIEVCILLYTKYIKCTHFVHLKVYKNLYLLYSIKVYTHVYV